MEQGIDAMVATLIWERYQALKRIAEIDDQFARYGVKIGEVPGGTVWALPKTNNEPKE